MRLKLKKNSGEPIDSLFAIVYPGRREGRGVLPIRIIKYFQTEVIMKRIDVVIVGLVVVGVFGLVFAGQTFSQASFSTQSGDGVAVGRSCTNMEIRVIDVCKQNATICDVQKDQKGNVVGCSGYNAPKCNVESFHPHPGTHEWAYQTSVTNWNCPLTTLHRSPCIMKQVVWPAPGGGTTTINTCEPDFSTQIQFQCPHGQFLSNTGC